MVTYFIAYIYTLNTILLIKIAYKMEIASHVLEIKRLSVNHNPTLICYDWFLFYSRDYRAEMINQSNTKTLSRNMLNLYWQNTDNNKDTSNGFCITLDLRII